MGIHVTRIEDSIGSELDYNPIQYRVEVYNGDIDPVEVHTTYGGWNVESNFLMVYDENGLKSGFRLPACAMIRTTEIPPPAAYATPEDDVNQAEQSDPVHDRLDGSSQPS